MIYTRDEIIEKIKHYDKLILEQSGMESYGFEDGHGKQSVKYKSMNELNKERNYWMSELKKIDGSDDTLSYSITKESKW